ncbi:iron-containing alcohol dehydrogenase [Candidatus Pacearchaeota archaeon]|nr:iron-containing alcohol dehydrogenase [Candidatus Pacearchaeota archaeon]
MIESKILGLLPKSFFPGMILEALAGERFLKSIIDKRVFIIISKSVYNSKESVLRSWLSGCNVEFFILNHEPIIQDKISAQIKIEEHKSEIIMGVGGGAVMDLAKILKMENNMNSILLPTTIGSGSESSQFALLIDEQSKKKIFTSSKLLPEIIIFNPAFCVEAPSKVITYSIADALSHAIEGLASRNATILTDALATKVIDLILENALPVYKTKNIESIAKLQIAGFLAGIVQSTASVGLIHGIAHAIGAQHNLAHSHAVSLYFIDVLKMNSIHSNVYTKLDSCKNVTGSNFVEIFEKLFKDLDLENNKVYDADAEQIRKDICTKTNPFQPSVDEIKKIIYRKID